MYKNINNIEGNSPDAFNVMKESDKAELIQLIETNLSSRKSINKKMTSYGLKHLFETMMTRKYISNGEMKGALLYCGYYSENKADMNWYFNISSRSPIFIKERKLARCKYRLVD